MAFAVTTVQAYVNTDATTAVSGSFDIANGDLIIAVGHSDDSGGGNTLVFTDNDADLAFTVIGIRGAPEGESGFVTAAYYNANRADTGVIVTLTAGAGADTPRMKIFRVTGHDTADPIGAVAEGSIDSDPELVSLTMETAGLLFGVITDWEAGAAITSADLNLQFSSVQDGSNYTCASGAKETSAGAQTGSMNMASAGNGNWLGFEVRAGAGGGPDLSVSFGTIGEPVVGGSTF